MNSRLKEIVKKALQIERKQVPTVDQVTRQPTAVIVKGNEQYIKGNKHATRFYNDLAALVRAKGYSVIFDQGKPYTRPPNADVWLGHSQGVARFPFAPKDTKKIAIGSPNGINHPMDKAMQSGQPPDVFHYLLTNEMKQAILKKLGVK